ncbi:MAG: 50S ribosomal protein L18 [Christensenellaceae bacterium]|jgi:large subunit ribosomal protein L18|nr:50S ribosomal protein L18 [Christensenellaceae bacterium]
MVNKIDSNKVRQGRHERLRNKLSGDAATPRLNVYRSLNHIYAQIIDDTKGETLVAASSLDADIKALRDENDKKGVAEAVGEKIAKLAIDKNITAVVYDRGGYLYTGRVASLAEGARKGGLVF